MVDLVLLNMVIFHGSARFVFCAINAKIEQKVKYSLWWMLHTSKP